MQRAAIVSQKKWNFFGGGQKHYAPTRNMHLVVHTLSV